MNKTFNHQNTVQLRAVLLGVLLALLASSSPAATFFWDADGSGLGCSGAGNWGSGVIQANCWGTALCSGTYGTWNNANLDSASFGSTPATVTLTNAVTVNQIITTSGGFVMSGASQTMTFAGPDAGVNANHSSGVTTLTCNYTGTLLTKTGIGRLELNNLNNTMPRYRVNAGFVMIAAINRLGTAPVSLVSDYFTFDGGGLGTSITSGDIGSTRGATILAGGAFLGASAAGNTLIYSAPIVSGASPDGGLTVTSGSPFYTPVISGGTWVLGNPANNWNGPTTVSGGTLRLGAAGVIPDGSAVNVTAGTLDMNGFDETVGSVTLGAATITNALAAVGSARTLTASSFTINNAGANGIIGAILAGPTATLTKSGGTITALNTGNTYGGRTTISGVGSELQVSADGSFGTVPPSFVADAIVLTNGGGIRLQVTAADLAANRGIVVATGGGVIDVPSSQSASIEGAISGTGPLAKITSGNLNLNGASTWSGGFIVNGGGVRFNHNQAAGTGTITAAPTNGNVTLRQLNPPGPTTVILTNSVVVNANGGFDIDLTAAGGNTFVLAGPISGPGYFTRGRATGSTGTVGLGGDNSGWSGGIYWGRGTLALGHKNALGTGTLTATNATFGTEPTILQAMVALTGANAAAGAISLTGVLGFSGPNGLELTGATSLGAGTSTITNFGTGGLTLSGVVSGAGASLAIAGAGTTTLDGASANTYAGGTTVSGNLVVRKDGGLGGGNVTVNSGGTLRLENGAGNNYIAGGASLLLSGATPSVTLNFSGAPNTITALSFDGGATFKAAGTWGAPGSGAQHTDARFSGTGMLNVMTGPGSTTVLVTSGDPAVYGSATLTATVTGPGPVPTGSVTFAAGILGLANVPLNGSGVAVWNVGTALGVAGSPHNITAFYSGDNDHGSSSSAPVSQTITPATVSATAGIANKIYDGTTTASINSRSLSGIIGSDDVNLGTSGTASFGDKNVGTKAVAVSGLALTGSSAGNYTLASDTVNSSADITAAPLSVSGLTANKVYDGTTTATITGTGALTGLVSGDDVTLAGTATGSFPNKNVGTGKVIALGGLTISGADSGNYNFNPTLSADISAAELTVTGITANNKPYDGDTNATLNVGSAVLAGVIAPDVVTLVTSNAVGYFADPDVADGKTVTITNLTLAGADAGNYALTQPTTTADIKLALAVSGITASDKVYDATTSAALNTAGAVLSGVQGGDTVTLDTTGAAGTFGDKNVGAGKPVTITGLTISGADANKYLLTATTTSASITVAGLTVNGLTAQSRVYDGTTAATVTGSGTLTGLYGSDVVNLTGTVSGTFADKNVGAGKAVAVAGLSLTGTDAGNYSLVAPASSADINALVVSLSGVSANNKIYDGTTAVTFSGSAVVPGILGGDTVTISGTPSGSFGDKAVGTAKPVGFGGVFLTGPDAPNYDLQLQLLSADITPAGLSVGGLTAQNKGYDGTTTATVTGSGALTGVYGSDVVTLGGTAVGTFADKNVGTAKAVSTTGLSISGADALNYALTQPTLSADITSAGLTVTGLTAQNKVYDGTTVATVTGSGTLTGVYGSDVVTLGGTAVGTFADKNVGTAKPVGATGLSISGGDAPNYSLTQPSLSADITSAGLTVTGLAAQNKVYDGTTVATLAGTAALSGVFGSDDVTLSGTASGAFADKAAGTAKPVSTSGLSINGGDAVNYSLTQPTLSADITAAGLTVTGLTAQNKVYDGTTVATVTGSGTLTGLYGSDVVTLSGTAIGTFADKNVGTGKAVSTSGLSLSGADALNYALTQPMLSADITAAGLTVTGLAAQNKAYDGTTVATLVGTAALSGVFGSDDVTLSGTASGSFPDKNMGTGKAVSVSGLSITGADAGNYSFTPLSLSADISAAELTVTGITANNKPYDGDTNATLNVGSAVLAGVIAPDVVTLVTSNAVGYFADPDVADGKTVTITNLTLAGADAGNYALTQPTTTADIKLALAASGITASDKVYDATTPAALNTAGAVLSGVQSGDTVTLDTTGAAGTFGDKNVGTGKTVTITGLTISGADANKYMLTATTTSATITPAGLTVNGLTAQSRVYDGTTAASLTGSATLSGVIGSEDVSLAGTPVGAFADKNVGTGKAVSITGLTITGADAGNYSLVAPASSADINAAGLTVTGLTAQSKVYDGTTAATVTGSGTLTGLYGSDVVTLTGTASGTFADKNVGTGKAVSTSGLSLGGADALNYSLTQPTLSADITPAGLAVTGLVAQNKVYDATTSVTITGTAVLAGVFGSDAVTLTGTASGTFADKNVGTAKPVSTSGLSISGADALNYALTQPSLSADITPAGLTVTGLTAQNKVYDGTTSVTITGTAVLAGVFGSDAVTLTGTASGTFADKNVGTAKPVSTSGLSITGADALNYSLTQPSLSADITSLATSNGLASSDNPSFTGSNVTFTATLDGVPPALGGDKPTGEVVFLANGVPFSTNTLVAGVASASTTSLPQGTNTVAAAYAGDNNYLGSTNSLEQVVNDAVTCSQTNALLSIGNNFDGTLTLSFLGTPQAQYYVVSSPDVSAAMSSWTVLAGSTNTVTNLSGFWTLTVPLTNSGSQLFYRSAAVVPCP